MALSDDQRKLLALLAKQDEAYEAIAAATGANIADLKARAAEAIAALEEEARDRGTKDEGARAAGPVAAGDPPPPAVAEASSGVVPPTTPPTAEASSRPRSARSESKSSVRLPGNRRLAELLGGALVVLLLILFATGAIDVGGGGSDDGDDGGNPAALSDGLPASSAKRATQAVLEEVDGSGASGRALFGRFKQQVVLVLAAKGLSPSPAGSSYAISLARSEDERIPIAATRVGPSGTISGQFQLPATVLGALASGYDEMEVSLVVNDDLEAALKDARGQEVAPDFSGETVLRGPVSGPAAVRPDSGG